MGIRGIGTETYLYVNGLILPEELRLATNKTLIPVKGTMPLERVSRIIASDVDYAIATLSVQSLRSQLRIVAADPRQLAVEAWNSQWDLSLLSAIFNCEAVCNLQSSDMVEAITDDTIINVTNRHLRGMRAESYTLGSEDVSWVLQYFRSAQTLLDVAGFQTAVHALASYRWHPLPRVQVALLWAGIESLFDIGSELSFRVCLSIAKFLGGKDRAKEKAIFQEARKLYTARSVAVHGGLVVKDAANAVHASSVLLQKLIRRCAESGALPLVDELPF